MFLPLFLAFNKRLSGHTSSWKEAMKSGVSCAREKYVNKTALSDYYRTKHLALWNDFSKNKVTFGLDKAFKFKVVFVDTPTGATARWKTFGVIEQSPR